MIPDLHLWGMFRDSADHDSRHSMPLESPKRYSWNEIEMENVRGSSSSLFCSVFHEFPKQIHKRRTYKISELVPVMRESFEPQTT
jgi:hypothetical protein